MARFSQHLEQMHSVKNYLFITDIAFCTAAPLLKQNQGSRKVPSGSPGLINLGNRTEKSPIPSIIIGVINKIGQLVERFV